jgi:hypothetical protein
MTAQAGIDQPTDASPAPVVGTGSRGPSLRRSLREAAVDAYFNSWRLVPANLAWGATLIAILALGAAFAPALLLLGLLAIPLAGLHRMAALISRGEPVALSDFADGVRRGGLSAAVVGFGATSLAAILGTNVLIGFNAGGPLGWFLGTSALYGLVALAGFLLAFWPILADPHRDGVALRRRLALAGLVVVGRPGRILALTLVIGVILAVSIVLLAAIVLIGVAYASLVASRYVLPLVDAVEAGVAAGRVPR